MTKWRVGTLSMSVSLILSGVVLLLSIPKGWKAFDTLIAWWPIVFVLLGVEILLFLFFSRRENPVIYYDVFSILFVLFLNAVCLVYALLSSTGVLGEIRTAVRSVEQTVELPSVRQSVSPDVKTIVVQSDGVHIQIDRTNSQDLLVFGQSRMVTDADEATPAPKPEDYVRLQTAGDRLYVSLKPMPHQTGLIRTYPYQSVTVVVPQGLQVEGPGTKAIH